MNSSTRRNPTFFGSVARAARSAAEKALHGKGRGTKDFVFNLNPGKAKTFPGFSCLKNLSFLDSSYWWLSFIENPFTLMIPNAAMSLPALFACAV